MTPRAISPLVSTTNTTPSSSSSSSPLVTPSSVTSRDVHSSKQVFMKEMNFPQDSPVKLVGVTTTTTTTPSSVLQPQLPSPPLSGTFIQHQHQHQQTPPPPLPPRLAQSAMPNPNLPCNPAVSANAPTSMTTTTHQTILTPDGKSIVSSRGWHMVNVSPVLNNPVVISWPVDMLLPL